MAYTSYVDNEMRPDQLDVLESMMEALRKDNKRVYVIAVPRGEYDLDRLKEVCRDIPEVRHAIPVSGTIDIVIGGDQKTAEEIGSRIASCTGEPIGCVEYTQPEEGMINFYRQLKAAIRAAREAVEQVHMYDPSSDSLAARAAALRKNLEGQ